MTLPFTEPVLNSDLSTDERPVLLVEVLAIAPGNEVRVEFLHRTASWRQGVWLATEGTLSVNGVESSQLTLWEDTAPGTVAVAVLATDGLLRLHNVWDSGRGLGAESQSATAGMVRHKLADGSIRYDCNDIGPEPDFTKFSFNLTIQ